MDPDPDPTMRSGWIRIRPNVVDPGGSGSGSGSETLLDAIDNSEFLFFSSYIDKEDLCYVKGRSSTQKSSLDFSIFPLHFPPPCSFFPFPFRRRYYSKVLILEPHFISILIRERALCKCF